MKAWRRVVIFCFISVLLAGDSALGTDATGKLSAAIKTYPQRIKRGQAVLVHLTVTNRGTAPVRKRWSGLLPFPVATRGPNHEAGDVPRVILPWTQETVRGMENESVSGLALRPGEQATFAFWLGFEMAPNNVPGAAPGTIRCVFSDIGGHVVSILDATADVEVEDGKSWMQDVGFASRLLVAGCFRKGGGAKWAQQVLRDYADEYNRTLALLFAGQTAEALAEARDSDLRRAVLLHGACIGFPGERHKYAAMLAGRTPSTSNDRSADATVTGQRPAGTTALWALVTMTVAFVVAGAIGSLLFSKRSLKWADLRNVRNMGAAVSRRFHWLSRGLLFSWLGVSVILTCPALLFIDCEQTDDISFRTAPLPAEVGTQIGHSGSVFLRERVRGYPFASCYQYGWLVSGARPPHKLALEKTDVRWLGALLDVLLAAGVSALVVATGNVLLSRWRRHRKEIGDDMRWRPAVICAALFALGMGLVIGIHAGWIDGFDVTGGAVWWRKLLGRIYMAAVILLGWFLLALAALRVRYRLRSSMPLFRFSLRRLILLSLVVGALHFLNFEEQNHLPFAGGFPLPADDGWGLIVDLCWWAVLCWTMLSFGCDTTKLVRSSDCPL